MSISPSILSRLSCNFLSSVSRCCLSESSKAFHLHKNKFLSKSVINTHKYLFKHSPFHNSFLTLHKTMIFVLPVSPLELKGPWGGKSRWVLPLMVIGLILGQVLLRKSIFLITLLKRLHRDWVWRSK